MAVAFAVALWFLVIGEKRTEVGFLIPLEFRNLPKDMIIVGEPVRDVEVRALVSKKAMTNLSSAQLTASIDLSAAKPGQNNRRIAHTDIKAPKGVEVIKVNPSSVTLHLETMVSKLVTVKVKLSGNPAHGYIIKNVSAEPDSVVLFGTQAQLKDVNEIYTTPFDVSGIKADKTKMLAIQLAYTDTELKKAEPDVVKARVSVGKIRKMKKP